MIWFTADSHAGHKRILELCHRPFSSEIEMDVAMIKNWNNLVKDGDTVCHLGDVTLNNLDYMLSFTSQLNGNIRIVPGGHDHRWLKNWQDTDRIKVLPPLYSLEVDLGGERPQVIVLCHYKMYIWDRSHYNSWNLYGHSHGKSNEHGKSMDVGVDCWNYEPISLERVSLEMANKPDNPDLVK